MKKETKLIIIVIVVAVCGYLWMRRREKSKSSDGSGSSDPDSGGIAVYPGTDVNNTSNTGKLTDFTDSSVNDPIQTLKDNLTIDQ